MIALGHTGVGALIGVAAAHLLPEAPAVVVIIGSGVVGIVSHYLMDLLPHGHYEVSFSRPTPLHWLKVLGDSVVPIAAILLLLVAIFGWDPIVLYAAAGIFGAQLPDLTHPLRSRKILPNWNWLKIEQRLHLATHDWHNPKDPKLATTSGNLKLRFVDAWQLLPLIATIVWIWP